MLTEVQLTYQVHQCRGHTGIDSLLLDISLTPTRLNYELITICLAYQLPSIGY